MFEKEAEEYAGNREVCDLLDAISEDLQNYDYGTVAHYNIDLLVEECFKDGAEHGYNKAKVEVEDSYRESLCNSELNLASVTEQLEELEKANKWHKVADGDLPKENNLYLVAIKDNGLAIAYFNGLHWETKFNLGDFGHCLETVIAWCEIPKFEEK